MAFTTTTGAGGTSLIGTSGVDIANITPSALTTAGVYIQAEGDNDIVNIAAGAQAVSLYNLVLGSGADTVTVGAGSTFTNSTLKAGDGTDALTFNANISGSTVSGLNGIDAITINGSVASSLINGNNDADNITYSGTTLTNGTIAGGQGGDTITVTAGTLNSGRVNGQDGSDTINVTGLTASMLATASINGGQGGDTMGATAAFNFSLNLSGDIGNDNLTGSNVADSIWGGEGNDTIISDFSAANTAAGFTQGDTMTGGAGTDTFRALTVQSTGAGATAGTSESATGVSLFSKAALGNGAVMNVAGGHELDIITDFAAGAGGDVVDVTGVGPFTLNNSIVGTAVNIAGTGQTYVFAVSGSWVNNVFTTAASDTAGPDTLVYWTTLNANGTQTLGTQNVVLQGVNASTITTANLV